MKTLKKIITLILGTAIIATISNCKKDKHFVSERDPSSMVSTEGEAVTDPPEPTPEEIVINDFSLKVVAAFQEVVQLDQTNYCAFYSILNNQEIDRYEVMS